MVSINHCNDYYSNDYIIIIYNPKALFTYMDLEGSISKELILSHLKEMDKHEKIDNQDHYNKTVEKLKLIFTEEHVKMAIMLCKAGFS